MKENIPLIIGRESSGEECIVNLADLPNLFISYSNEVQLPEMFRTFITNISLTASSMQFAFSLSNRMAKQIRPLASNKILLEFTHADYDPAIFNSIDEFIGALMLEFKHRKVLSKNSKKSITRQTGLLVFIEDIFEIIMSPHKKTSLSFIELLITGPTVNIYFIMGSAGIYRNLLNQLINVTPSLQEKLKKSVQAYSINQPLGAELVMNPDGLLFFREREEKIHRRLYPGL
jgi:hypothetical protein